MVKEVSIPVRIRTLSGLRLGPFVPPELVGEYFVGKDRKIEFGREKASLYHSPGEGELNLDLNIGFEDWKDPGEGEAEKIDVFLKWICADSRNKGLNGVHEAVHDANVVAARGILRRIALTPHLYKAVNWTVTAQKHQGITFIHGFNKPFASTEEEWRSIYHGQKFEQYVTRGKNEVAPNPDSPVKNGEQFRIVCLFQLDVVQERKFTILLSGEVDAIDDDGNFLELKLAKVGKDLSYDKCLNTWIQSTFTGVNKILFGFKDDKGYLKEVKEVKKCEIFSLFRGEIAAGTGPEPNFLFLHRVLSSIDQNIEDGQSCVVEFEEGAQFARLRVIEENEENDSILSDEFRKFFNII